MDEANNLILRVVLTTNDFKDNEILPILLNQLDPNNLSRVTGDGAYDEKKCFAWAEENKIKASRNRNVQIQNFARRPSSI